MQKTLVVPKAVLHRNEQWDDLSELQHLKQHEQLVTVPSSAEYLPWQPTPIYRLLHTCSILYVV